MMQSRIQITNIIKYEMFADMKCPLIGSCEHQYIHFDVHKMHNA